MFYETEAQRWRALATRDPNANGHFFYSVKSTQIYCRPTCPARLARRANISFQKTIAEAEALGFRACKRCRPNIENEDPQDKAVAKAMSFVEEAARKGEAKNLKLHDLAKKVGLTPRYFHKIFKDKTGTTPREYTNIVAAQYSGSSPATASEASLDKFDWESFDISELANFQFDSNSALDDNFMAQAVQITAAKFGEAFVDEVPTHPRGAASPESLSSDTDSTLSWGLDIGLADFRTYQTIHSPIDPTIDFDLSIALLLQNDLATSDFTLDLGYDFDVSSFPMTSDFMS